MVNSLKIFRKTKDGRGAWLNPMKQHGGDGKWEKAYEALCKSKKLRWKSSDDIPLEQHTNKFRDVQEQNKIARKYTTILIRRGQDIRRFFILLNLSK